MRLGFTENVPSPAPGRWRQTEVIDEFKQQSGVSSICGSGLGVARQALRLRRSTVRKALPLRQMLIFLGGSAPVSDYGGVAS